MSEQLNQTEAADGQSHLTGVLGTSIRDYRLGLHNIQMRATVALSLLDAAGSMLVHVPCVDETTEKTLLRLHRAIRKERNRLFKLSLSNEPLGPNK